MGMNTEKWTKFVWVPLAVEALKLFLNLVFSGSEKKKKIVNAIDRGGLKWTF